MKTLQSKSLEIIVFSMGPFCILRINSKNTVVDYNEIKSVPDVHAPSKRDEENVLT